MTEKPHFIHRADKYTTWAHVNGTYGCSCRSFYYRADEGACKHILQLVLDLGFENDESKIPTCLEGFNNLVGDPDRNIPGGLPLGTMTALFGEPGMGKTTINFQLACDFLANTNRRVLLVDTEGSVDTYRTYWEVFKQRFNMPDADIVLGKYQFDPKKKKWYMNIPGYDANAKEGKRVKDMPKKTLIVLECRNIRGVLDLHGRGVNIEHKAKKSSVLPDPDRWIMDVYETPIGQLIMETDVGYVSYDSISQPLKEFGVESQNLPQRAEATAYWMGPAQQLFAELNLGGIATMHFMKDPTNPYSAVEFEGGKNLGHTFKYVLRMQSGKDKMRRRMAIHRHPGKGKASEEVYFQFTNNGLVDVEGK